MGKQNKKSKLATSTGLNESHNNDIPHVPSNDHERNDEKYGKCESNFFKKQLFVIILAFFVGMIAQHLNNEYFLKNHVTQIEPSSDQIETQNAGANDYKENIEQSEQSKILCFNATTKKPDSQPTEQISDEKTDEPKPKISNKDSEVQEPEQKQTTKTSEIEKSKDDKVITDEESSPIEKQVNKIDNDKPKQEREENSKVNQERQERKGTRVLEVENPNAKSENDEKTVKAQKKRMNKEEPSKPKKAESIEIKVEKKVEFKDDMSDASKIEEDMNRIESQNVKQIKISKIKPKKMWIPIPGSNGGHRRVPAIEVRAGKEHKSSVKIWLYEEFLSNEECDLLVQVHEAHLKKLKNEKPIICFDSVSTLRRHLENMKRNEIVKTVTPNDFINGTMCINQTFSRQLEKWGLKWSSSTAFYLGESKFSNIFSKLIEDATMLNQTHGGKFQITSYPNGIGYNSRTDCNQGSTNGIDRYATFLVFLNDVDPKDGGEIVFNELGIDVKPKKGRALTWNNMNYETGTCEKESTHEGKKFVGIGKKKYIIKRWYYYKNFHTIGKRVQEPEIPKRTSDTPRIVCDNYDFDVCHLYDEWSYDHLLQYRKNIINI